MEGEGQGDREGEGERGRGRETGRGRGGGGEGERQLRCGSGEVISSEELQYRNKAEKYYSCNAARTWRIHDRGKQ